MLLNNSNPERLKVDDKLSEWKIINYRSVNNLITAEFLHDLYNQAEVQINPVHFRNTVCIIENGTFKSYAPKFEWDMLAKVLGNNLIFHEPLRAKFSQYLEKPQDDLLLLIEKLNKKYDSNIKITNEELFYDLSDLHFLALNQIYAINLVQFEHALDYAIKKLNNEESVDFNKLLRTDSLTKSSEERLRIIELSLYVSDGVLSQDDAISEYIKEFSSLFCAYGANLNNFKDVATQKFKDLLNLSVEEREKLLDVLKSKPLIDIDSNDTELSIKLSELAKKLAIRRDRNKALMGKVAEVRIKVLDRISKDISIERNELDFYFLNDIYNLLVEDCGLSKDDLEKRKGRLVIKREEKVLYESAAIKLSQEILPKALGDKFSGGFLYGNTASSGNVKGYVRRVFSINDAMSVKPNEILVAYGTDFDLITGLQNCAGVITEEGGILSHASVISRELGKPCLINVNGAMSRLQDGLWVEIDTINSRVEILDENIESRSNNLITLSKIPLELVNGAKARNLRLLFDNHIPVLDGFLINIQAQANLEEIATEIMQKFSNSCTSCIVRSNSLIEDTQNSSMAGQFQSVVSQLEVSSIIKAIHDVVSSYEKPKIASLPIIKTSSVLIQPYYEQEFGGVAFSYHPVTGQHEAYIEVSSLGASGVVNGQKETVEIPFEVRNQLIALLYDIEKILKCPVDIEWGFGKDGIKIFQARPIVFRNSESYNIASKKLMIIAGGQGSRIKKMFNTTYVDFTKHVLPIPERGGSIIGAIVSKAEKVFSNIDIIASDTTVPFLTPLFQDNQNVGIVNDQKLIGPLYYPFKKIIEDGQRVFACCGDIYSNFNWNEMERFHNEHKGAVTILISKSFETQNAACFEINDLGQVINYQRKPQSTSNDLINIGAYILDPSPDLTRIINELIAQRFCKEDLFFEKCIEARILYGYTPRGLSCNINTPEMYSNLVQSLRNANM